MANTHSKKRDNRLWEDASSISQIVAELTRAHGNHPLAFFGLAPENEHFLAPEGKGLVNYRLINNTAVVPGDPLCAPEAVEQVTRSFLEFCSSHRWSVAFYQASVAFLASYRALNLRPLKMGEEAILSPQTFTVQGALLANVRTSCRRAEREGIYLQWYEGVPPAAVLQQLEGVSRAWLKSKGGEQTEETGFSVGRLDEVMTSGQRADHIASLAFPLSAGQLTTPRLVTGVALTRSGNACAFVTFTPIYGAATGDPGASQSWGWALDLMRRTPDAAPGVMELLLVWAIERFRREGAHVVSLGLVAWADSQQEMSARQRQLASFVTDRLGQLGKLPDALSLQTEISSLLGEPLSRHFYPSCPAENRAGGAAHTQLLRRGDKADEKKLLAVPALRSGGWCKHAHRYADAQSSAVALSHEECAGPGGLQFPCLHEWGSE